MHGKVDSPWILVAKLAAGQHGVLARRQLMRLGFDRGAIDHALLIGRLHRVYRGVYAVGHPRVTLHGRYMAAVLACGESAVLSHRSAANLWGLKVGGTRVEVTARGGPDGILVHKTRHTPPATTRDRIPLTSLGRTLVDLADMVSAARLERAYEDAERLGLLNVKDIHPIPGRRGEARIRALIEEHRPHADTKTELERQFASLIREECLPWPVFNTLVEGFEVDVLWRDQGVVVELDSYEFHGKIRRNFERDREKDPELRIAGYEVLRVTSRRISRKRDELVAQLRFFLSTPAASASGRSRFAGGTGARRVPGS